jgi:hypothetical protein
VTFSKRTEFIAAMKVQTLLLLEGGEWKNRADLLRYIRTECGVTEHVLPTGAYWNLLKCLRRARFVELDTAKREQTMVRLCCG